MDDSSQCAFSAAELKKLDPQLQLTKRVPDPGSGKVSGMAWAENERWEKEAGQAQINRGPKLASSLARTNVHKASIPFTS